MRCLITAGSLVTHLDLAEPEPGTQVNALHHLQQLQQGFSMPAGQLQQDLHQMPLSHLPTTPLQQLAEQQLQRLTQVSSVATECEMHLCHSFDLYTLLMEVSVLVDKTHSPASCAEPFVINVVHVVAGKA